MEEKWRVLTSKGWGSGQLHNSVLLSDLIKTVKGINIVTCLFNF